MVPVRSARTPQFEERVYQWSRRHRKGSACGCGFRQGRRLGRWAPPNGSGWRSGFPCLRATLSRWGRCREGHDRERGDTWFARLPAGGADQRSAFPCLRAALARGGTCRDGRHTGTGRYVVRPPFGGLCRPEVGVPLPARHSCRLGYVPRRASYGNWAIRGSPAFRRAVPGPTGRTAQRSAFPCLRATLARGGTCRDGRHTGTGRYVVRPPFGGRCRAPPGGLPRGRRSLACVLSERAAVRAVSWSARTAYKGRTPGPDGPGVPVGFRSDGCQETQFLTSPCTCRSARRCRRRFP